MAEIKTGGPAFPFEGGDNNGIEPSVGMTLRDYLASQAAVGLISANTGIGSLPDLVAKKAYAIADAMIAAREGGAK